MSYDSISRVHSQLVLFLDSGIINFIYVSCIIVTTRHGFIFSSFFFWSWVGLQLKEGRGGEGERVYSLR